MTQKKTTKNLQYKTLNDLIIHKSINVQLQNILLLQAMIF